MDKYLKLFLTITWALLIFTIISYPFPEIDVCLKEQTWYDKGIHLVLFFVFAALLASFLSKSIGSLRKVFFVTFLISLIYAAFSEFYQAYVPGRDVDEYDFLAGLIGALLGVLVYCFLLVKSKPKLLLHICCIGCGAHVSRILEEKFQVTLFFYNPNIYPKKEYELRLSETSRVAKKFNLPLLKGVYSHKSWLKNIKGLEKEKEKGARCYVCYLDRLEKTVKLAKKEKFSYFTSTLSISPYKDADKISQIGKELEDKYGVKFFDQDFKKNDGFKKSVELSKKLKLYRQNYCGCEFSRPAKTK